MIGGHGDGSVDHQPIPAYRTVPLGSYLLLSSVISGLLFFLLSLSLSHASGCQPALLFEEGRLIITHPLDEVWVGVGSVFYVLRPTYIRDLSSPSSCTYLSWRIFGGLGFK